MQILSPLATSSEKHEPQWIEFIDMQVRLQVLSLPGATLTAAVPVPDLHAVLLLRDGVDPVIGLTAVPVVVVVGGAVRPLKVTLLVWGEQREAVLAEPCLRCVGGSHSQTPSLVPHSPGARGDTATAQQRPNSTFGFYN